jgi:putative hemolysin
VGDTIEVEGRTLAVLELDGRRISRLSVDRPADEGEDAAGLPSGAPTATA